METGNQRLLVRRRRSPILVETGRGTKGGISRILGFVVGGLALVAVGAIAAIAGFFAILLLTMVWWPAAPLLALPLLALLTTGLVRARGPIRTSAGAALLLSILGIALFVPTWFSSYQHDAVMGQVKDAVCSMEIVAVEIRTCTPHTVENPFNGNQCGYEVTLRVATDLSREELATLLAERASANLGPADGLYQVPPFVQAGLARDTLEATILFVGDEGSDFRCM